MSTRTVLVVEDDDDLRIALCHLLKDEGFTAVPARNGMAALQVLSAIKIQFIILDMSMPVMSGEELLKILQADPVLRKIPVCVVTEHRKAKAMAAQFVDCVLMKPFDIPKLVDKARFYTAIMA